MVDPYRELDDSGGGSSGQDEQSIPDDIQRSGGLESDSSPSGSDTETDGDTSTPSPPPQDVQTADQPSDPMPSQPRRGEPTEQGGTDPQGDGQQPQQTDGDGADGASDRGTADIREETTRASQSVSLGTRGLGTSGTPQSRRRERTPRASETLNFGTDTFGASQVAGEPDEGQLERGSTAATDAQIEADIEDVQNAAIAQQSNLERQSTAGPTPDYTTAAVNRVEEAIDEKLEEAGIDSDDIDVNARVEDGEIRVGGEDVNARVIRFPSEEAPDTAIGEAFGAATDPIFAPFGVEGENVAAEAAEEAGVGGERLETVLGDLSSDYLGAVEEYREPGGEAVQQTVADFATGPFATGVGAKGVADLGVALADERTDVDIDETVDARSEDVYEGFASVGDAPGLALTAKDAAEYTGFAAEEVAEGDAGVVAADLTSRAAVTGAQAALAFEQNPGQFTAQVGGSLIGGAAVGGAASATGVGSSALRAARRAGSRTRSTAGRATDLAPSPQIRQLLSDRRGQADFGTQATQRTLQRDRGDVESDSGQTTIEDLEEADFATVRNTDSTTDQLSDVEAEARTRLPDQDEFSTRAEFERELTQMMRRIESRRMRDTQTEIETQQTGLMQTSATAVGGVAGAEAVEATEFEEDTTAAEEVTALGVAAEGVETSLSATETEALAGQMAAGDQISDSVLAEETATTTELAGTTQTTGTTTTATQGQTQVSDQTATSAQVTSSEPPTVTKPGISLDDEGGNRRLRGPDGELFTKTFEADVASAEEILDADDEATDDLLGGG